MYILWDVARRAAELEQQGEQPRFTLLQRTANDGERASYADLLLVGEGLIDQLGFVASTPAIDVNRDRVDDLIVAAARADRSSDNLASESGTVYVNFGSPERRTFGQLVPDLELFDPVELTNRTVTGSGDFLVDEGTGRPFSHDGTLTNEDLVAWYEFTTLGAGKPGNLVRLSPVPQPTEIEIQSTVIGSVGQFPADTPFFVHAPGIGLFAGDPDLIGIVELDLSSVAFRHLDAVMADPDFIEAAVLSITAETIPAQGTLEIAVLSQEGDGVVRGSDGDAAVAEAVQVRYEDSSVVEEGTVRVEGFAHLVTEALRAGKTRMTLRVESKSTLDSSLLELVSAIHLNVRTKASPAAFGDLFDASGGLLAADQSVIDLRRFPAGQYFLRVHTPDPPGTDPLPFTIEIMPPKIGATHPIADRDEIRGSDGPDILVGNGQLDRLFGDSGADHFFAESVEARDPDNGLLPPTGGEEVTSGRLDPIDSLVVGPSFWPQPEFVMGIPDRALHLAIAEALGIPITAGYDGQAIVERPIHASQMATITSLDLVNAGIAELRGLEYAIGLTHLNLSRNGVATIEALERRQRERYVHDLDLGPASLRVLIADGNRISDLSPVANAERLTGLSADFNPISEIPASVSWPELRLLSIDQRDYELFESSFDADGRIIADLGTGGIGRAVAVQPDGKILVVGDAWNGRNDDIAVARFHPDGSFDMSFGGDGKVVTPVGDSSDGGNSVVLQPDGKIVVAGYTRNGLEDDFTVVRYERDGELDAGFGGGGKVITSISSGSDQARSVALYPDGKIVAAGFEQNGNQQRVAVRRYQSDGAEDDRFDPQPVVGLATSVSVQRDGKVLVAGATSNSSVNARLLLARYTDTGELDSDFGDGGVVTAQIWASTRAEDMVLLSDGKILVAASGGRDFAVLRFNRDGSPDDTFGNDGKVITATELRDEASALALQSDGKIILAGWASGVEGNATVVARYNADGSLDHRFGDRGFATTKFVISDNRAHDVAIDGNTIVTAGFLTTFFITPFSTSGAHDRFTVTQLNAGIGLLDLGGLSEAANLQTLSVANNAIEDVSPLTGFSALEQLNLRNNQIRDISPLTSALVGDNAGGVLSSEYSSTAHYFETGEGWTGDKHTAAFDGDYRLHGTGADAGAFWSFQNVPEGIYDVQVTWPSHASRSPAVVYELEYPTLDEMGNLVTAKDVSPPVNQQLLPAGGASPPGWPSPQDVGRSAFGQPWQSLQTIHVVPAPDSPTGYVRVALANGSDFDGPTMTIAADAVRLIQVDAASRLAHVDLRGNPLDNLAHEVSVGLLGAAIPAAEQPLFDDNPQPPVLSQIASPSVAIGEPISIALDAFDPDNELLRPVGSMHLEFDGFDDYVAIPDNSPSLDTGSLLTIETWFKTDSAGKTQTLVMHGLDDVNGRNNALQIVGGKLKFNVRGGDGRFEPDPVGVTTLVSDRWYHAAFTFDGSLGRLYLDGVLEVFNSDFHKYGRQ